MRVTEIGLSVAPDTRGESAIIRAQSKHAVGAVAAAVAARPTRGVGRVRCALVCALACAVPPPSASAGVFPGATWQTRSPADAGLDADRLAEFSAFVGGRGCIVRGGHMVHTWGDQAFAEDISSASKPWYTHFLLQAVEQGLLSSVDEFAADYESCLQTINAPQGFTDRLITFRQLANQTAGYGFAESPGDVFAYNDFQMALFWDTLFLHVYGATYATVDADVLHPLTDAMQCQDNPTFLAFGQDDRPGRMRMSVRDLARFGVLYLNRGNWNGTQLLGASWVDLATTSPLPASFPRTAGIPAEMCPDQRTIGGGSDQSPHMGGYSWLWWVNGIDDTGQRLWPDAPTDAYGAFGHWGRRVLFVMPGLDMVVAYNDSSLDTIAGTDQAWAILTDAVLPQCHPATPITADLGNFDATNCLRRVATPGGDTVAADIGERNCRRTATEADTFISFDVDDGYAFEGNRPRVDVAVTYYDQGTGAIALQYDSATGDDPAAIFATAGTVPLTGTDMWLQHTFKLTDAYFGNRQDAGTDLRVVRSDGALYLDSLTVTDVAVSPVPTQSRAALAALFAAVLTAGTITLRRRRAFPRRNYRANAPGDG